MGTQYWLTVYLGGHLKQCRSVNPCIRNGVFNPFKPTDRSVIIGSLVLLHVTAVIFILLQKLLCHVNKQCRPLSDIFSLPCVYVGLALFVKFLYMGARLYWANWLRSNNVKLFFCLRWTPLTLTCTPFDNWLPGCYKGTINKAREACFCISCSFEQPRSNYTNTILVVQVLTFPSQSSLPRTFTPFITAFVRQGVKTVSAHPKPGPKKQPCSPLEKSTKETQCRNKHKQTRRYFFMCQVEWCGL